jgi:hypothetical protein
MLCGYEPFYGESDAELIDANKEAHLAASAADWDHGKFIPGSSTTLLPQIFHISYCFLIAVSVEARELVQRCWNYIQLSELVQRKRFNIHGSLVERKLQQDQAVYD